MRIFLALSKLVFTKSLGDLKTPFERPISSLVASTRLFFEGNLNSFEIVL